MDKKKFTETDIRTKFITPAIEKAGWDKLNQMREEFYFTAGKIQVLGQKATRQAPKKADYILSLKDIQLVVIEAKDNKHSISSGIQQALGYAKVLDIPFVFSSNGDGFYFHNRLTGEEKELPMDQFPTPKALWEMYKNKKKIDEEKEKLILEPCYIDRENKKPRYYQQIAINKSIEAISNGEKRLLLVMATGTGKTYTAFQIMHKLWKTRKAKRILFLADRNILIDQSRNNDFSPFSDKMTKIKNRTVDKSYEVYLSLYQAITGEEEDKKIFKEFSKDFFDFIIIDECHRGSAKDDSSWREILEYFDSAIQLGLTATPKETKYVSNVNYFGEPLYTYSLKEGIEDGFLAPYKVIRVDLDKDLHGFIPEEGQLDDEGKELPQTEFRQKDMDRKIILTQRTELVAKRVTEFLEKTNPFHKTIVFCDNIDHAERMRNELVKKNPKQVKENSKYIMRITGDEDEGKNEIENFINPEKRYPVIVTTSKLLSTGVDAKTCKLIVLDKTINSMTEFKQTIGRGTRVEEEFDKMFFTIIDFKGATRLFNDPDFDGEPEAIYEPREDEPILPSEPDGKDPKDPKKPYEPGDDQPRRIVYMVSDEEVSVIGENVQYIGAEGKLRTESFMNYTKKTVSKKYPTIGDFINSWKSTEDKKTLIKDLENEGLIVEELKKKAPENTDIFDLICHLVFGQELVTKTKRIEKAKTSNTFSSLEKENQEVLLELFKKYKEDGIDSLENMENLKTPSMGKFGTPLEIVEKFQGKENYTRTIKNIVKEVY